MKKWIVKDLVNGVYAKSMSGDYTKGLVNLMLKQNGENTTFIDITSPDGDSIGVTCGYSFSYRCMQYDVDGDTYNDVNDAMGSIAYRIDMIAEQLETYIVMKEWRAFETEEFCDSEIIEECHSLDEAKRIARELNEKEAVKWETGLHGDGLEWEYVSFCVDVKEGDRTMYCIESEELGLVKENVREA